MIIIDRTKGQKNRSAANRQKFIARHRRALKEAVDASATTKSLKDLDKGGTITVKATGLEEYSFEIDKTDSVQTMPIPERTWTTGDRFPKQDDEEEYSPGNGEGDGEDSFEFSITPDEFIDLYLGDLELPNFYKKKLNVTMEYKLVTGGITKVGSPVRLHVRKTFEAALARKLASRGSDKKPAFLDDVDLRYRNFIKQPKPIRKAVLFCLMDVSGSVEEQQKSLAKKFFTVFFLFLRAKYKYVELRFIRYHSWASEVDEEEFFYGRDTGGTSVKEAFRLTNELIKKDYSTGDTNIYIAHASDGDLMDSEKRDIVRQLQEELIPACQYVAYVDLPGPYYGRSVASPLWKTYKAMKNLYPEKVGKASVKKESQILVALRQLFGGEDE